MFLGYGETEPDPAPVTEEVDEAVKRRVVLAAMMNEPFLNLRGEPITLPLPTTDDSLPSRLFMAHVYVVRTLPEQLRALARFCGGQADQFMGLAHQAGDTYAIADAAWHAGATLVRDGYPNDALKHFQLGGFWAGKATSGADNPRMPTLVAWLTLSSATAYALMDGRDEAIRHLARAHDGWEPRDAFERAAMDRATAAIHLDLGRLDTAEQLAARALGSYSEDHRRGPHHG